MSCKEIDIIDMFGRHIAGHKWDGSIDDITWSGYYDDGCLAQDSNGNVWYKWRCKGKERWDIWCPAKGLKQHVIRLNQVRYL